MKGYSVVRGDRSATPVDVGTVVFPSKIYDYGLAADDTVATGIRYISVTKSQYGGGFVFTIPHEDLAEIDVEELPEIDDQHAREVCRIGQQGECCRYLTMASTGWSCEKLGPMGPELAARAKLGKIIAQADNCEGRRCR